MNTNIIVDENYLLIIKKINKNINNKITILYVYYYLIMLHAIFHYM